MHITVYVHHVLLHSVQVALLIEYVPLRRQTEVTRGFSTDGCNRTLFILQK